MESPRRKFDRLVTALDALVASEADTVAARAFPAVADIQQRTGSLVSAIVAADPRVVDAGVRARIAGILARRQHTMELLEAQLATSREELRVLDASTRRAARIVPIYGRPDRPRIQGRLNALG